MKKKITIIILVIFSFVFLSNSVLAWESSIGDQFQRLGEKAGVSGSGTDDESVVTSIASVIEFVLGLLGVIFVILIIYSGFMWMTAGGNETQVENAKKIIIRATIGVIIILASYAITWFVMEAIESF